MKEGKERERKKERERGIGRTWELLEGERREQELGCLPSGLISIGKGDETNEKALAERTYNKP